MSQPRTPRPLPPVFREPPPEPLTFWVPVAAVLALCAFSVLFSIVYEAGRLRGRAESAESSFAQAPPPISASWDPANAAFTRMCFEPNGATYNIVYCASVPAVPPTEEPKSRCVPANAVSQSALVTRMDFLVTNIMPVWKQRVGYAVDAGNL